MGAPQAPTPSPSLARGPCPLPLALPPDFIALRVSVGEAESRISSAVRLGAGLLSGGA